MRVEIAIDTKQLKKFATQFPRATQLASEKFAEQAGRTVERHAKKRAPVIHGYLRRSIFFVPAGGGSATNFTGKGANRTNFNVSVTTTQAVVVAYANYAKYVHGAPFFQNSRARKETPFFTYALIDGQSAIQQYARDILPNVIKNIGRN